MTIPSPTEQLRAILESGSVESIREFLHELAPKDVPHVLSRLDAEEQTRVLSALPPDEAARLVQDLPLALSVAMFDGLPVVPAAAILDELPSDEQTDLLTHLEQPQADAVLARMAPDEAADVRRLRDFPDDTAGGLMVTEYLAYPATARVGDVVRDLRAHADRYAQFEVQYAYVVSERGELLGVASLRNLLFLADEEPITSAVAPNPVAAGVEAGLDDLRDLFERHSFLATPIVDDGKRLVGVVTRADVEEAAVDRAERNLLRFSGIVAGEEFRTMPLRQRAVGRLTWLAMTMLLSFVAASVIGLFEETLSKVIALAVFLPIISGMSGNAGNQAIGVTMRELALGLVRPHEIGWVIAKEAALGAINGLALGLVLSLAAWLWKGNPYLGLVVGGAQALSVLAAACLGGTIPLLLKRWGIDPALASAPILTTITDASGFFIALAFATWMLPWLA